MSNTLHIHNVKRIRIREIHQLKSDTYVIDITIKIKEGFFDISLFSNDKDNLKIL